jgi:hypothetical protein
VATKVSCCPSSAIEAVVDYNTAGSAKNFLERIGVLAAARLPSPRIQPGLSRVHTIPLFAPLPLAGLQHHFNGEPAPDQGKTLEWPHPDLKREEESESG